MRNPLIFLLRTGRCGLLGVMIAVMLTPWAGAADDIRFTAERFAIDGRCPIAPSAADAVLSPFTGRPLSLSDLETAAAALEDALLVAGYAFYRVSIPPQRISQGVVTLRVTAFTLQQVQVEGNTHFDTENILGSLPPLVMGESPNTLAVARAIAFANEHPAKRVAVFVKQDPAAGGIDARVVARDMRPYQVFAAVNNTGTTNPGRTRLALGVQHSNLFNRDHVFTGTYTTSPDNVSDVNQYGLDYRLPLYELATELEAFYTYSQIDQGLIGNFFDVSGRGQFFGFSATHILYPVEAFSHRVAAGYQDRFFDNDTRFGGAVISPDVRSTPVSLRYSADWSPKNLSLGGFAAYEFNTGSGAFNDPANYTANRAGAQKYWNKFHGGGHLDWELGHGYELRGRFSAQYANQPLIPGEQFGIGGSRSVRGYEEREVTGDSGIQGSIEGWSPKLYQGVRLVLFADAGEVRRQAPHPGLEARQSLSGLGIGIRWNWKGHVDVSCDLAHALNDAVTTEARDTRLLYQVFLRY